MNPEDSIETRFGMVSNEEKEKGRKEGRRGGEEGKEERKGGKEGREGKGMEGEE